MLNLGARWRSLLKFKHRLLTHSSNCIDRWGGGGGATASLVAVDRGKICGMHYNSPTLLFRDNGDQFADRKKLRLESLVAWPRHTYR
jgi:hypothetical protein